MNTSRLLASIALVFMLAPLVGAACQELRVEPRQLAIPISNYQAPTNFTVQLFLTEDPLVLGPRCSVRWTLSEPLPPGITVTYDPPSGIGNAPTYSTLQVGLTLIVRASGANAPDAFARTLTFKDNSSNMSTSLLLNFQVGLAPNATATPTPTLQPAVTSSPFPIASPTPKPSNPLEQLVKSLGGGPSGVLIGALIVIIIVIVLLFLFYWSRTARAKARK